MPAVHRLSAAGGAGTAPTQRNRYRHPANQMDAEVSHPTVEIISPNIGAREAVTRFGITAEFVEYRAPGAVECRFQAPVHLLIAYEQGARHSGTTFVEGLPQSTLQSFARKLTFVPAGHEYRERHEASANIRLTYFYIDPSRPAVHSAPRGAGNLAPRVFFEDATAWQTAAKLKALLSDVAASDQFYLEALALVLLHDIAHVNRGQPESCAHFQGGLAAWQQRIVTTHIEDHLAEKIPLAALAGLVDLSQSHFCRAFKKSFGKPPHRYQIERRIECAKTLLAKPPVSVTDIALKLGFGHSSSFASVFRKVTGLTATDFSRSL